jgi:DNA repair exonuclease SbcCD ATPase subunit
MRIAHISDIHIRGLQRHSEYRAAFNQFFERCKDLKVDAIFVGGDIWHTKTQGITPEAVSLITHFFKGMSDIAPVYVTLGNHDGILSNTSRLDAISPIISAIGSATSHPIVLCKKSGIYPMHVPGFNLCVFSCFDEEGWKDVKPVEGCTNIAAFHGGIAGCLLDSGIEYDADTSLDLFEGFDVAMLGDIHRMQFLGSRQVQLNVRSDDLHRFPGSDVLGADAGLLRIAVSMPWVGYSGSFLQQNYGEDRQKGFLVWDVSGPGSHSVWFEDVPTPDPYVTIKWLGDVSSTVSSSQLVKGCRVRLTCDDSCTPQDERQLQTELRLLHEIREFVTKRDKRGTAVLAAEVLAEDLRSPAAHMKLIREMMGDYHTAEEWKQAEDIVCKALGDAGSRSDDARGVTWSVQSLEFDNLFTYAGNNSIDFSEMRGVTGIFGPNRIGKSSIIGAMVYCMFNTTDRGSMKNIHVIRTGQQSCRAKMDIVVADRKIQIERASAIKHEKNGRVWAPTSLTLTDSDDNASGEQRSDTEKTIRRTIGTVDDFFMTALSAQGTMNRFIDEGATSRKTYLGRFLDLDIFDRVLEAIKPDSNVIKARLKALPDRDWAALISDSELRQKSLQSEVAAIDEEVSSLHKMRTTVQEKMLKSTGNAIVTEADLSRLSSAVSKRKRAHDEILTRLTAIDERIAATEKRITAIEDLKRATDIESLRAQLKTQRDLERQVSDLTATLRVDAISLSSACDDASVLREIPCGDSFTSCKFIKRSFESREKIKSLQAAVDTAKSALKSAQSALSLITALDTETKITAYTTAAAREGDTRSALKVAREEKRVAEDACKRAEEDHKTAVNELTDATQRSEQDSAREAKEIKDELDQINQKIDSLGVSRGEKQSEITRCDAENQNLKRGQEEFRDLKRQWRVLETLLSAYSKKGLPSQVLDKLLPAINSELSEILSGIVPFQVQLEIDQETNSLEIYIDYGDSRRIIELGSGMEKMISSLAIRVALTRITSLPKPDFIVIDEGFGTLDETQLVSCINMIKSLKRIYRFILVISHVDAVKDAVDQVIEITREGGASRVSA